MLWERIAEALMEDSDSILYVTRMDDYQILYMNNQVFQQPELPGNDPALWAQPCYKLLHGKDEPCSFCKRGIINRQDFYRRDYYHEASDTHYWIKDKIITVNGVECHMQVAMRMTEQLEAQRRIQRELEKERVLLQCVKTLEGSISTQNAVDSLLETVARYFSGDRAYLFEFDYEKQVTNNTFEWAAEGVEKAIDLLQEVPLSVIGTWIDAFHTVGSFYISDLDDNVDRNSDTYQILELQGIRSLIAVPLEKDGEIIGFFGVDNPRQNYEDISLLSTISVFILNALEKRAYHAMLEKLSYEDSLTGLYNRHRYNHTMEQLTRKPPQQLAIVYMDLNNLKVTNDTMGHDAGDALIRKAARIIRETFGEETYRIGGDEFVAFLTEEDEDGLRHLLKELNKSMAQNDANVSVGYSYRSGNVSAEEQMSEADDAMYAEKLIYRKLHSKR